MRLKVNDINSLKNKGKYIKLIINKKLLKTKNDKL